MEKTTDLVDYFDLGSGPWCGVDANEISKEPTLSLSLNQSPTKTILSSMGHFTSVFLLTLITLLCVKGGGAPPSEYPVDEHIFESIIDHFNFRPTTVPTFPLRYYVNEQNWNSSSSPCFFYAGNEADIFQFINNSGFLFEAAEDFGALVVSPQFVLIPEEK